MIEVTSICAAKIEKGSSLAIDCESRCQIFKTKLTIIRNKGIKYLL
jgi:hypothetical protein